MFQKLTIVVLLFFISSTSYAEMIKDIFGKGGVLILTPKTDMKYLLGEENQCDGNINGGVRCFYEIKESLLSADDKWLGETTIKKKTYFVLSEIIFLRVNSEGSAYPEYWYEIRTRGQNDAIKIKTFQGVNGKDGMTVERLKRMAENFDIKVFY